MEEKKKSGKEPIKFIDIKRNLDKIDDTFKLEAPEGYYGYYESALKKQLLMWVKGEAISNYCKEVWGGVPYIKTGRKVKGEHSWGELREITERNLQDLIRWYKIYENNPDYEKFEEKAELKAQQQAMNWVEKLIHSQPSVETPPLPKGKYKTIIIDPPWPMEKIWRAEERPKQYAMDYPTMSLEEIGNISIPDLAYEEGCHIYLWVTHKFLPEGLKLFEKWGVKYQCIMTWIKNVGITPFSWMYSTEHVLFGRIGNLSLLENGIRLDFKAKVTKHSEKPDIFYEIVKRASPEPRLDMFWGKEHDGFELWGIKHER